MLWREQEVLQCRVGWFGGPRTDDRLRNWRRAVYPVDLSWLYRRRKGRCHERRASFENLAAAGIICSNGCRTRKEEYWHPVRKVYVNTVRYEGTEAQILDTLVGRQTWSSSAE